MAVIIGFGTTVGGAFSGSCATSVNWGLAPNVQRLYCLGSTDVHASIEKPQENVSVTIYQGTGPTIDITPSTTCDDITSTTVTIDPASCGGSIGGISGNWYLSSYNYTKGDPNLDGTESYSFTRWVAGGATPAPDHVIRNMADGQATQTTGCGIDFYGTPSITGLTGSVAAGGTGTAQTTYFGTVQNVGGASIGAGNIESGSANGPLQPLWV